MGVFRVSYSLASRCRAEIFSFKRQVGTIDMVMTLKGSDFEEKNHLHQIMLGTTSIRLAPQQRALSAALHDAKPNTTILLSPGMYVEPDGLDCDTEGISILGYETMDLDRRPVCQIVGDLTHLHGRHFFRISSTHFLMRNVKIQVSFSNNAENLDDSDETACVSISNNSRSVFENCEVSSQKILIGFSVQQHSRPWIKFCAMADNKW